MNKTKYKCLLLMMAIPVFMILISCETNNSNPSAVPTIAVEEITKSSSSGVASTPIATNTMEPTLAYWATAQEERFNAEGLQQIETKQAISNFVEQYPQMCGFQVEGVFVSPNREWIASNCKYDTGGFRVFQTHGNLVWDIPYSKIFPYYPDFVGGADALHWSADGNFLYFATWSCCPDIDSLGNGNDLYRLNLEKGDWELVIKGNFHHFAFSPDGQELAYTPNNQTDTDNSVALHFLDLDTNNEEVIYAGDFDQAGIIAWRQDGEQLMLLAQNGSLYTDDIEFALVLVDLHEKKSHIVIDFTEDGLYVISWSKDNILTISRSKTTDYYGYYINVSNVVYYDLKSDLFVTPTPNK